ncbi:MAG TPA: hypothetical protein VFX24_03925, partial [Ktedonobacterales bacterium]|nr:hypothetical protein [Ktedonobacterales bacterium]
CATSRRTAGVGATVAAESAHATRPLSSPSRRSPIIAIVSFPSPTSRAIVAAVQEAHFEPQHHRVPVQADGADRHARPALIARLRKAGNVGRDALAQRLAVQRLDLNSRREGRTGGKTLIAANARRHLTRYLRARLMHCTYPFHADRFTRNIFPFTWSSAYPGQAAMGMIVWSMTG